MKKILALLVAVMMMAVPAMAEMVIVQDGLAPEVVAPVEGVVLTDVSKRADLQTLAEAFAANLSNENVIVEMFAADITEAAKVTVKAVADAAACVVDGHWEALAIEKTADTVSFISNYKTDRSSQVHFVHRFSTHISADKPDALSLQFINRCTDICHTRYRCII